MIVNEYPGASARVPRLRPVSVLSSRNSKRLHVLARDPTSYQSHPSYSSASFALTRSFCVSRYISVFPLTPLLFRALHGGSVPLVVIQRVSERSIWNLRAPRWFSLASMSFRALLQVPTRSHKTPQVFAHFLELPETSALDGPFHIYPLFHARAL